MSLLDYDLSFPDFSAPTPASTNSTGLSNSEIDFLKTFPKYNDTWLTPTPTTNSLATSYSSPTPQVNSTPDIFTSLFEGLSKGIGTAVPAFLNTASTNLANQITKTPTVQTPKGQVTSAGVLPGISNNTLLLLAVGAVIVYLLVK
jgi:hypothetical protein